MRVKIVLIYARGSSCPNDINQVIALQTMEAYLISSYCRKQVVGVEVQQFDTFMQTVGS